MLFALLFSAVIASAFSADITDNRAPELEGRYMLTFAWPPSESLNQVGTCAYARYSHKGKLQLSCECGRKDARLAILWEATRFMSSNVMFDIVNDFDEASRAMADSCSCEPYDMNKVVALKLNENMMLQYEQDGPVLRHKIFSKVEPTEAQMREVISKINFLKYEDGMLLCKQ